MALSRPVSEAVASGSGRRLYVLAHPSRIRIIDVLGLHGELSVSELAEAVGVASPAGRPRPAHRLGAQSGQPRLGGEPLSRGEVGPCPALARAGGRSRERGLRGGRRPSTSARPPPGAGRPRRGARWRRPGRRRPRVRISACKRCSTGSPGGWRRRHKRPPDQANRSSGVPQTICLRHVARLSRGVLPAVWLGLGCRVRRGVGRAG